MTVAALAQFIESELQWREKELALLKVQLHRDVDDAVRFRCSYRAFVSLTYAHFEGFSKTVSAQALLIIKTQITPNNCVIPLTVSLLSKEIRKTLGNLSNRELVFALRSGSDFLRTVAFPSEDVFFDISNLDVPNFTWLLQSVGLEPLKFTHYRRYVGRLVSLRHACAHGEWITFDGSLSASEIANEIYSVQSEILTLMHQFGIELVECIDNSYYAEPIS